MQGLVLTLLALLAIVTAQTPARPVTGSGCCFYDKPAYGDSDKSTCIDQSITFSEPMDISSYWCDADYSAAIFKSDASNADPDELVDCGDEIPSLLQPIGAVKVITVGPCSKSLCCLYEGDDFTGGEYCISDSSAPVTGPELDSVQAFGLFKSVRCQPGYQALLAYKEGSVSVPCGGELKPSATKYLTITVSSCAATPGRAEAEVESLLDESLDAPDNAIADEEQALDEPDNAITEDNSVQEEANDNSDSDLAFAEDGSVAADQTVDGLAVQSSGFSFSASLLVVLLSLAILLG